MCEYSSTDGFANDWHLVHLGSRAVGGAGLVLTEAIAVTADGRISPVDLGIYSDAHIEQIARIGRFCEEHGAAFGTQLAHAGRKASNTPPWLGGTPLTVDEGGWRPIWAPSASPFAPASIVPEALDEAGIAAIVRAFADAAKRSEAAGWRERIADLPDPDDALLSFLPSRAPEGEETGYSQARALAICRRLAAVHCLYGVDLNPLAVELAPPLALAAEAQAPRWSGHVIVDIH